MNLNLATRLAKFRLLSRRKEASKKHSKRQKPDATRQRKPPPDNGLKKLPSSHKSGKGRKPISQMNYCF